MSSEAVVHSPVKEKDRYRREHVVIMLDDDLRIEGDIVSAVMDQVHEVAFALAKDNGMEFDALGRPAPTTRPNAVFGPPKRKKVTLTLVLTLDPETAIVWQGRHAHKNRPRATATTPLHPKGDFSVSKNIERVLRAHLLLELLSIAPLPEMIEGYRALMGGQYPPQRRLTAGRKRRKSRTRTTT